MLNPCVLPWKSHETMEERDNTPTVFKSITPVIFWLFIQQSRHVWDLPAYFCSFKCHHVPSYFYSVTWNGLEFLTHITCFMHRGCWAGSFFSPACPSASSLSNDCSSFKTQLKGHRLQNLCNSTVSFKSLSNVFPWQPVIEPILTCVTYYQCDSCVYRSIRL